jgi:RimJ/RimL family protein N-acetyltransferase
MKPMSPDVTLTPITLAHAPKMFEWMLDPEVRENLGVKRDPSLAATTEWIAKSLNDPSVRAYAILLSGNHVGNVILDRIDPFTSSARMSIYIGEGSVRGKGVGRAGLYKVLCIGFHELNLNKIWLTVHCQNCQAINSYLSLGFVVEGVLRDEFILRGNRISVFYMGLLKKEFDPQI